MLLFNGHLQRHSPLCMLHGSLLGSLSLENAVEGKGSLTVLT